MRQRHVRSSKHHGSRSIEIGYVEELAAALFLRAKVLPNIHTPHVDYALWSVVTTFRRKLLPPIPVSTKNRLIPSGLPGDKQVSLWFRRLVPGLSPRRSLVNPRPSNVRILGGQSDPRTGFSPRVILLPKASTISSIFYTNIFRTSFARFRLF